jgi:hypothetical protein
MRLRPRYSLLTLLILTALVAGGVKLWYGPHHVIERPSSTVELEYSYDRDWRGNKVIDGPYVSRDRIKQYPQLIISLYRQGVWVNWTYTCVPVENEESLPEPMKQTDSPLTPQEWQVFRAAVEREKQQAYPPGTKLSVYEGRTNVDIF